jgi:hypothetical protein
MVTAALALNFVLTRRNGDTKAEASPLPAGDESPASRLRCNAM